MKAYMARVTLQAHLYKLAYWTFSNLFLSLQFLTIVTNSSPVTIKTLPGFNGTLPFHLETGYVNVGEANDVELFYYFLESEKNPENDPLILWLAGGPGCSGLSSFIYDSGPLHFDLKATSKDLPSLVLNPYSWTKIANIIYLDSPAGTGFSYATSSKGYYSSNTKCATDIYDFLRKWLLDHPKFVRNHLYIGGDSYAGIYVPMVALEIDKGNEAGYLPYMSLQGYVLGNPLTNYHDDLNSRILYLHRMALISGEYFNLAEINCNGEYVKLDLSDTKCIFYVKAMAECAAWLNPDNILDECIYETYSSDLNWAKRSLLQEFPSTEFSLPPPIDNFNCSENKLATKWANDHRVQQALHIREGTKPEWARCNRSISFEQDVDNVVEYHRNLSQRHYRALVYSGDHDLVVPYIGTLLWIKSLNLSIEYDWKPWFVNGQIAGYTEKYKNNVYSLTFATVKGAGHVAMDYKPKESLDMIKRWFSMSRL